MIGTPAGTWLAARARIVGATVAVLSRTGELLATYDLDSEPTLVQSQEGPQLVGTIDGQLVTVAVDPGCLCDQTRWEPYNSNGEGVV